MGDYRITKFTRHEEPGRAPWHSANVSCDGATREFHDRTGSWMTDRRPRADADWPPAVQMREAVPRVAALLAQRARREERRAGRDGGDGRIAPVDDLHHVPAEPGDPATYSGAILDEAAPATLNTDLSDARAAGDREHEKIVRSEIDKRATARGRRPRNRREPAMAAATAEKSKRSGSGGRRKGGTSGSRKPGASRPKYPAEVTERVRLAKAARGTKNGAPGAKQHLLVEKALDGADPAKAAGMSERKLRQAASGKMTTEELRAEQGLKDLGRSIPDQFCRGRNLASMLVAIIDQRKGITA